MATYWMHLNGEVVGPYEIEKLIRVRGFSRNTQVCREDGSGQPGAWMSPAEIPELAKIFKSVDEMQDAPAPRRMPPKPIIPRPVQRPVQRTEPSPVPAVVAKAKGAPWGWIFASLLLAAAILGGGIWWLQQTHRQARQEERHAVQELIETTSLPATSAYPTLRQCMQEHHIQPQWDFEPMTDGLYHATLSWFTEPSGSVPGSAVYAFEVNIPAQSLRGLNTAAAKLLSEGFVGGSESAKKSSTPAPTATERFKSALIQRNQSIQNGDFDSVWSTFSQRKRSEMIQGGISQSGFVRLQALTHKLETGQTLTVEKTKDDGASRRLVLIRQSQDKHPDIMLKQLWVLENNQWKLDTEEKHSMGPAADTTAEDAAAQRAAASAPTAITAPDEEPAKSAAATPTSSATPPSDENVKPTPDSETAAPTTTPPAAPATPKTTVPITSLPGLSN